MIHRPSDTSISQADYANGIGFYTDVTRISNLLSIPEFDDSSFLTTHNFQTQFGREVVFNNEIKCNQKFKKKIEEILKKNPHLEAWKWQNCMFEKNVISTINRSKKFLKEDYIKNKENYNV